MNASVSTGGGGGLGKKCKEDVSTNFLHHFQLAKPFRSRIFTQKLQQVSTFSHGTMPWKVFPLEKAVRLCIWPNK